MSESSGGAAGDSSTNNAANNALQITGSIVSILTFIYALGVGLYFYAKTAASSPQEINEFIISLQFSYEEMQRFAHSLANYERERMNVNSNNDNSLDEDRDGIMDEKTISPSPVVHNGRIESIPPARLPHPPPPDPEAQALAAKAYLIEGHTATRLEGLRQLALKVGTMASDGFFRQWSNRVRYVLLQEELGKQVAGKDRLMEELRRVQESFDKAADDRRQMRYERLLDQQNRLLRSVTHRLRVLETRVMNRKTVNDDEDDDSGDDADDRFDFDHDTKVDLNGHVRQHQQQQQQQQQRKNTPISKRMYNSPTTNNDEDEDENSSSLKDSGFHSREDTISTRSLG